MQSVNMNTALWSASDILLSKFLLYVSFFSVVDIACSTIVFLFFIHGSLVVGFDINLVELEDHYFLGRLSPSFLRTY